MVEILSQLSRKPSKATAQDLENTSWTKTRNKVLRHMEKDATLRKLLDDFTEANNELKFLQSRRNLKVYFTDMERGGEVYTYARCFFVINGKQKEFRKYIGKTADLKEAHIDHAELNHIFLHMLDNYQS